MNTLPNCPQCGCAPRHVWMVAKVKCEINPDESVGRVVSAGKRHGEKLPQYICGGGHIFPEKPETAPDVLVALQDLWNHYQDLLKSNPGLLGKVCLQDFALMNKALINAPEALKKAKV